MSNTRQTYIVRHPITNKVIAEKTTTRPPTHAVVLVMNRKFSSASEPFAQMTSDFKFGVICLSGSEDLAHKQARAHGLTEYVLLPVVIESEGVEATECEVWYTGGKKRCIVCTLRTAPPVNACPAF